MQTVPNANRKHIAFYGKTNSGKSSLLNRLTGQEVAIVSEQEGTTTDPVIKAMELIPVGPVVWIDTAGVQDETALGKLRLKKTMDMLMRTDIAIYVMAADDIDIEAFNTFKLNFKKYAIPFILVISQVDKVNKVEQIKLKEKFKDAILTSVKADIGIEHLKEILIKKIQEEEEERPLVGDLLPYGAKVILVVPIDSEAPKGRIILPQVQCIRDCLDHGIKSYVVRDTELAEALTEIKDVDLVITDSQAFATVSKIVPESIKLTGFSLLMSRQKGDLDVFMKGIEKVKILKPGARVLILEGCTHNVSHEDIGRIKIPRLLNKYVGGELKYTFIAGQDFPGNLSDYDIVIHCGGCMLTRKTVCNRIRICEEADVAITNYGILLAFLNGILERSYEAINVKAKG
nr:[FeFe] hydrogenase H-cluster maturation GTPase HydF [uncultured Cellulosilyticum sp.]